MKPEHDIVAELAKGHQPERVRELIRDAAPALTVAQLGVACGDAHKPCPDGPSTLCLEAAVASRALYTDAAIGTRRDVLLTPVKRVHFAAWLDVHGTARELKSDAAVWARQADKPAPARATAIATTPLRAGISTPADALARDVVRCVAELMDGTARGKEEDATLRLVSLVNEYRRATGATSPGGDRLAQATSLYGAFAMAVSALARKPATFDGGPARDPRLAAFHFVGGVAHFPVKR
jgi:hypothetical protein